MNFKVIITLIIIGTISDLIDGIFFQIYSFKHGFKLWDISTWSSAPSYFDYIKTAIGAILTFTAIAPWITLIVWLQIESFRNRKD